MTEKTKSVFRGVDLGGFNSACASSTPEEPYVIAVDVNDLANRATPSIVSIGERNRLIGEAAEGQLNKFPKSTYTNIVSACLLGGSGKESSDSDLQKRFAWGWEVGAHAVNGSEDPTENLFVGSEISDKSQLLSIFLKKLLSLKHIKGAEKHEKITLAVPDMCSKEDVEAVLKESLTVAGLIDPESCGPIELAYHSECLATQWLQKYREKLMEEKTAGKTCLIVDVGYSQTTCCLFKVEYSEGGVVAEKVEDEKKEEEKKEDSEEKKDEEPEEKKDEAAGEGGSPKKAKTEEKTVVEPSLKVNMLQKTSIDFLFFKLKVIINHTIFT